MIEEIREGAITMKKWNEFQAHQKHQYFLFLLNLPTEMLTAVDRFIIKVYDQYPVETPFDIIEG